MTAGSDWFDLPAPAEADLPKLYRQVEALRLRNQLDPKRFYRKDEGEGKGIKGLPKFFAVRISLHIKSLMFIEICDTDRDGVTYQYTLWYSKL